MHMCSRSMPHPYAYVQSPFHQVAEIPFKVHFDIRITFVSDFPAASGEFNEVSV